MASLRAARLFGHVAACGPPKAQTSNKAVSGATPKYHWERDQLPQFGNGSLRGKTLFITGASRGIGLAIAKRAAKDGANVIICAKTTVAQTKLEGTIYTAAEEIRKAGGKALAVATDIRFEEQVQAAVEAGVKEFGGIDICINNASAISLTRAEDTTMKKYDLMHTVNSRGTFMCAKACLPYLKKSENPHILTIAPPLNIEMEWFAPHVAYTMAKFGMSLCTLGLAGDLQRDGIAVNALWPRTTIDTAAVRNLLGGEAVVSLSRTPEIMADAAHVILTRKAPTVSGQFFVDEFVMRAMGVTDFSHYAVTKGMKDEELAPDFFV